MKKAVKMSFLSAFEALCVYTAEEGRSRLWIGLGMGSGTAFFAALSKTYGITRELA